MAYTRREYGQRVELDWWTFVGGLVVVFAWGVLIVVGGLALYAFPIEHGSFGAEHVGMLGVVAGFGGAFTMSMQALPELLTRWRGDPAPLPRRRPRSDLRYTFLYLIIGACLLLGGASTVLFLVGVAL